MPLEIVRRAEWGAMKPRAIDYINQTVPFVIIHHSYTPPACLTSARCTAAMRSMQRFHQIERGWFDIGYQWVKCSYSILCHLRNICEQFINASTRFAVGGDGKVYEGRGFNVAGAHAPLYNNRYFPSKSICVLCVLIFFFRMPSKEFHLCIEIGL